MTGVRKDDRRSNGGRGDSRRDDDRKKDNKDDRRSSGRGGHQNQSQRSSHGGQDRNGSQQFIQPDPRSQLQQQQSFGGGGGRGANSFNGMAFSESQLMDEVPKKKFTGRCRLFVGNLPNEVKETELKELFSTHGDIAECYLSGKGFAFLRLDTRAHAESAKEAIDGRVIHGRQVRVRFAVHGAAIRVKELSPTVSNEMLYHAFSHFGDVERAVHIVDEKGRPTGEGIVEFERKPNCNEAMAAIREKVFLLTASPKPLVIEVLEPRDEDDGLAERMIPRTTALTKERELGPRFPTPNSFEFVYGMKWKELYDIEKKRRAQLEEELRESRRRLEADMELAYQDYQAQMLREDLQRRQQELERLESARRERMRGLSVGPGGPGGMGQFGGPPPAFQQQQYMGGPPQQQQPQQQQGPPMMGGPPPFAQGYGGGPQQGMFQQQQQPQQQQQQPVHGGPPPQLSGGHGGPMGPQGQGGRTNMIEGVQRLLQIFKNDPNAQAGILGGRDFGVPPPQQGGMYGNSPQFVGNGEFPPEKKVRRN